MVAAVQAFVLRHLLFGDSKTPTDAKDGWKAPGKKEQKQAVCYAIANIIWGCASSKVGTGGSFGKVNKHRNHFAKRNEANTLQRQKSELALQ